MEIKIGMRNYVVMSRNFIIMNEILDNVNIKFGWMFVYFIGNI